MKAKFSLQILEKSLNNKFHENPPSGNWQDRTQLIMAFSNF